MRILLIENHPLLGIEMKRRVAQFSEMNVMVYRNIKRNQRV